MKDDGINSYPHPSHVLTDPDFHELPEIERLKVLYKIDPDYRRMHPKERWKVVNMIPRPPTSSSKGDSGDYGSR